ncbi:MarR family transcriptional regulator [Sulfolobales archaeon HS-7]|nr:MarR family transcriptional regulator [Sulfolobales archaeon HS-7]
MISGTHIWKSFKGKVVNEDVTFSVNKGEVVSFLGPNGGGKTTLMRQIYGELKSDKGEIEIDEMDPYNALDVLGVVPQDVDVMDGLTSFEHIYIMGMLKGLSRREAKEMTEELMERFSIENKKVDALSGGNKRKVLIASALTSSPKYLILDEPTTGLDPQSRREVWNIISDLKRAGTGIILTTHYLEEAEKLSDRIYFLNRKILLFGKTGELRKKFANYYQVINVETGEKYNVREEELLSFIRNLNYKYEIRLPDLDEIYDKVISNEPN